MGQLWRHSSGKQKGSLGAAGQNSPNIKDLATEGTARDVGKGSEGHSSWRKETEGSAKLLSATAWRELCAPDESATQEKTSRQKTEGTTGSHLTFSKR